ncbi:hypothetical protein B0H16DRAFT_1718791 [Mycena metata]|uniref:Uncharacterized protein n=1 Tax=Mycena metata TaxID=1033252 RepID=A0AAD7JFZ0_9AGAR|nr:hypothetical protein B0H16DRAFT_1718791 [Mycena metata]
MTEGPGPLIRTLLLLFRVPLGVRPAKRRWMPAPTAAGRINGAYTAAAKPGPCIDFTQTAPRASGTDEEGDQEGDEDGGDRMECKIPAPNEPHLPAPSEPHRCKGRVHGDSNVISVRRLHTNGSLEKDAIKESEVRRIATSGCTGV